MTDTHGAFAQAWERSWRDGGAPAGTAAVLAETPAYPLARTVPMPGEAGYPTGALGFRLLGLTAEGLDRLAPEGCRMAADGSGGGTLHLTLDRVRVAGTCSIDAKRDPVVTLDVGGSMRELPDAPVPAGSGDPTAPTPDPQTEAWLDQARDQRPKLAETANGVTMLQTYYANNDTYAELFQTSGAVRSQWSAGGITKQMAGDTSTALDSDTPVNAGTYGGQSYNSQALGQKANVVFGCVRMANSFPAGSPEYLRWVQAATDAVNFSSSVQTTTGNTSSSTTPMTGTDVYTTVASANAAAAPTFAHAEVVAAYDPNPQAGGAGDGGGTGRLVLDEATRARLRALGDAMDQEAAENAAVVGTPLFTSACGADLPGVSVSLAWRAEDGEVRVLDTRVTLPAFAFDIDDSGWTGAAGDVVRSRLESLRFLHSVVYDAVAEGIRAAVAPRAAAALTALAAA
jgi:hypothetical protein